MKNVLYSIGWLLFILLITILHFSFINTLFPLYPILHGVLIVALLLCILEEIPRALSLAAIGGYLLDLHSSYPFGILLIALFSAIGVFLFFQQHVFKQKAFHAMVINTTIATVTYHLVMLSILWFLGKVALIENIGILSLTIDFSRSIQAAGVQIVVHDMIIGLFAGGLVLWQKRLLD